MNRLLLTGAPGWLATRLLESFARDPRHAPAEVVCLVQPGVDPRGINEASTGGPAIRLVRGSLEDGDALQSAVTGCDAVLHAAAILHVRRTADWYRVNTDGTARLLQAAAQAGAVRRFVFISSNAAAGRASRLDHLLSEADPARPLSDYGRSKLLAEQLVLRASHFETTVLRPCMFYGPPVPLRHVEIYRRLQHGSMPLVGTGDFARSLTHIDNLVEGCRLALQHPRAAGEVYYIADEKPYTTRMVIEAMARALDVLPRYLRLPGFAAPVAYGIDRTLASVGLYWTAVHLVGEADWHVGVSVRKAMDQLGYRPTVALDEGMREAVRWCRQRGLVS